jgi:mono/diheme cytochrome c family protein
VVFAAILFSNCEVIMPKNSTLFTALVATLLGAASTTVTAFAQAGADTHGTPPQGQLSAKDNQKTVPVKITAREYDISKLLSAPPLSPEATVGRALWQQRCAYCHDGMGQPTYKTMGSWIDSDTVKNMGPDVLKSIISAGVDRMPSFKYDLDDKQMNALIEFLKTVSPSLKPTPAQLAGKAQESNNAE